jgi:hypothetical protein
MHPLFEFNNQPVVPTVGPILLLFFVVVMIGQAFFPRMNSVVVRCLPAKTEQPGQLAGQQMKFACL